jgi:hypothetical protein
MGFPWVGNPSASYILYDEHHHDGSGSHDFIARQRQSGAEIQLICVKFKRLLQSLCKPAGVFSGQRTIYAASVMSCPSHHEDTEREQCVCDTCWRVFHEQCLTPDELERWQDVQGTESPFVCRQCHQSVFTAQDLPRPLQWFKVKWKPKLEPLDGLAAMIDDAELSDKLRRLTNKRHSPASVGAKPPTRSYGPGISPPQLN